MSINPHRRQNARPRLESLEERLVMSLPTSAPTYGLTPPANTIGLALGTVSTAGGTGSTTVTISPQNITVGKKTTEFGIFVQPYSGSGIVPRIVSVTENGKRLPAQLGRTYNPKLAGERTDMTVAFFETGTAGTVTVNVAGKGYSTGSYTVETTLPGDVLGEGTVNLADEQAFASTYAESYGQPGYNAAADYNQNGIINLYDALALERNMTPISRNVPPWTVINLAPPYLIHSSTTTNSGGVTNAQSYYIDGYTIPGSIVLADNKDGTYKFNSQALATTSRGFFTVQASSTGNSAGLTTYNFEILDPFGSQYIRSFPVVWTAFTMPHSKYQYKPAKPHKFGTGKFYASVPTYGES